MLRLVRNIGLKFPRNQLKQFSSLSRSQQQGCFMVQPRLQWQCTQYSSYSTDSEKPDEEAPKTDKRLPKLRDDKVVVSGPWFGALRFSFKAMQIRNNLDPDFNLNEFVEASKTAVETVSNRLAAGDLDGLRGLVRDDVIDGIRDVVLSMTDSQRNELRVGADDICRLYVSDIELPEGGDGGDVHISMVYHVVRGFKKLTEDGDMTPSEFFKQSSKFLDESFFILNYKFTKTFSKDSDNDWIVSYINHVNISDEMEDQTKEIMNMIKKSQESKNKKGKNDE